MLLPHLLPTNKVTAATAAATTAINRASLDPVISSAEVVPASGGELATTAQLALILWALLPGLI